jgi:type II secretory pathway pseudopilin PulG
MTRRIRLSDDDGTSLIEVIVGMALMAIFMSIFVGVIVAMTNAQSKTQSITQTSANVGQAFLTLDKTVRYSAAISAPGTGSPSGDWYVEYRTTNSGVEVCTQLRVDVATKQLQRRTWTVANSAATGLTGWTPVASEITNGGAAAGSTDQPFVRPTPAATADFQQLKITLASGAGPANGTTTTGTSFTITAVNSSLPVPTTAICQEAGRP